MSIQVERLKITDFQPAPDNANLGSEIGSHLINKSIETTGAARSGVADKNRVLVIGNHTQEELIERGLEDVIVVHTRGDEWVIVQRDDLDLLNDDEHYTAHQTAYYDNYTALKSITFDVEQLRADRDKGVPVDRVFLEGDLQEWDVTEAPEVTEDDAPDMSKADELQEKWQVETGDLWVMGDHMLLCGDATAEQDVERLLKGESVGGLMADPPYGISHDTNYTRFTGGLSQSFDFGTPIAGDNETFDPTHLLDYDNVIIWGANNYPQFLTPGSFLVWDKRNANQQKLMSDGEIAWFNQGHGTYIFNHTWNGFDRDSEKGRTLHPTQKPVALFIWCLEFIPNVDIIYDPYGGSGPVMAACEQLNRQCRMMEIHPPYCAVILERLANLGLQPERLSPQGNG